jgi:hypothetical protein
MIKKDKNFFQRFLKMKKKRAKGVYSLNSPQYRPRVFLPFFFPPFKILFYLEFFYILYIILEKELL